MTSILQYHGTLDNAGIKDVPSLSRDGRYLVNTSGTTLVVRDLNDGSVRVLAAPAESAGAVTGLGAPDISADGKFAASVMLYSGTMRVVLFDLTSGVSRVLPVKVDGKDGVVFNSAPSISGDGRYIAINAGPNELVLIDTATGIARKVGHDEGLTLPAAYTAPLLSDDGSTLLYGAVSTGVVSQGNLLMSLKLATNAYTVVNGPPDLANLDMGAARGQMSADGRYVVFDSLQGKLASDTNGLRDVYLNDTKTGVLTKITTSTADSMAPSISADGRYITYTNAGADQVPGAIATKMAVYRKDVQSGEIIEVSAPGTQWTERSGAVISGDGTHIAFLQRESVSGSIQRPFEQWVSKIGESGTAPSEVLVAMGGNQHLQGGGGIDTVVYHGARAQYTVTRSAVTDTVAARDGADTLGGIERLRFNDGAVALDVDGVGGQAFRLYQAAFDRAPDQAGLGYWIAQMDKGATLYSVASNFAASAEFTAMYGNNPGNGALVPQLYLNILNRAGDPAGIAYWNDVLNKFPKALPDVLLAFSESAENVAALVGVMENGVAYQPYL